MLWVHFCDQPSTEPLIHISCDPERRKRLVLEGDSPRLPNDVFLREDKKFYTYVEEHVTCPYCLRIIQLDRASTRSAYMRGWRTGASRQPCCAPVEDGQRYATAYLLGYQDGSAAHKHALSSSTKIYNCSSSPVRSEDGEESILGDHEYPPGKGRQ